MAALSILTSPPSLLTSLLALDFWYSRYPLAQIQRSMPLFAEGTGVPIGSGEELSQEDEAPSRVRVKNRRKTYLDKHPEYFGPQLELAGVPIQCA
jgi:hypothetical protein